MPRSYQNGLRAKKKAVGWTKKIPNKYPITRNTKYFGLLPVHHYDVNKVKIKVEYWTCDEDFPHMRHALKFTVMAGASVEASDEEEEEEAGS